MADENLSKIFDALKKSGKTVFGPKEQEEELHILELAAAPSAENLSRVSDRPWKYFFMPPREALYECEGGRLKAPETKIKKIALFGMSYFDCKALELYDKVFANDAYYAERRKNIFVVGSSAVPVDKIKTIFFEPDLVSAVFDIFIESLSGPAPRSFSEAGSSRTERPKGAEMQDLAFYAQTPAGEKILKSAGLKYEFIKYAPRKNDKKVLAIKKALEKSANIKMWDELGKICLACGKCTIACPTCYCFDMESKIGPECETERCSGNCFYDDFTRIAGGHKFLNSPKEKIFFWYYHKFARIPFGYDLPGCVDCGRCTAVCPVGIDIAENIGKLLKNQKKNGK